MGARFTNIELFDYGCFFLVRGHSLDWHIYSAYMSMAQDSCLPATVRVVAKCFRDIQFDSLADDGAAPSYHRDRSISSVPLVSRTACATPFCLCGDVPAVSQDDTAAEAMHQVLQAVAKAACREVLKYVFTVLQSV